MNVSGSPLHRGSVLWMAHTAILMGMNIVLSMSVFSIPVPGGHLYFCDTVINIAAILLDPLSAFFVGGVGSFLGDFFFYPAPMFVSLFSHGLQAVAVSLIARKVLSGRPVLSSSIAVTVGGLIMVAGYTLGRAFVYSTPEYAIIKLPFEFLQAAFGAVGAVVLLYPLGLKKIHSAMLHGIR